MLGLGFFCFCSSLLPRPIKLKGHKLGARLIFMEISMRPREIFKIPENVNCHTTREDTNQSLFVKK